MRAQDGGERCAPPLPSPLRRLLLLTVGSVYVCVFRSSFEARVALERVRVKEELARVRSSGPLNEIPSGRVFDELPTTASDEATGDESPRKAEKVDVAASRVIAERADTSANASECVAMMEDGRERKAAYQRVCVVEM